MMQILLIFGSKLFCILIIYAAKSDNARHPNLLCIMLIQ